MCLICTPSAMKFSFPGPDPLGLDNEQTTRSTKNPPPNGHTIQCLLDDIDRISTRYYSEKGMIACTDVHYGRSQAIAACLLFRNWPDDRPYLEVTEVVEQPAAYEPGRFYRRELPGLQSVLARLMEKPRVVVIDGYVWLGDEFHPGLGAYLYEALGGTTGIIGVAKTLFQDGPAVRVIKRGTSLRPLYVTAAGIDLSEAAQRVVELHGEFRIPTLLKKVDRLCRCLSEASEKESN